MQGCMRPRSAAFLLKGRRDKKNPHKLLSSSLPPFSAFLRVVKQLNELMRDGRGRGDSFLNAHLVQFYSAITWAGEGESKEDVTPLRLQSYTAL